MICHPIRYEIVVFENRDEEGYPPWTAVLDQIDRFGRGQIDGEDANTPEEAIAALRRGNRRARKAKVTRLTPSKEQADAS